MPYGIKNETREDIKFMEDCVVAVQRDNPGYSKERCIRICKASRLKHKMLEAEKSRK